MAEKRQIEQLIKDIQYNCDISDARDNGIYSMCTMVLKLRNLYKWEKAVEPWQEPESAVLLDWIEAKENYWTAMAGESYRDLNPAGKLFSADDIEKINDSLIDTNLYYGAGHGRSMKAVFFLAEKLEQRSVEGCPVIILGREAAKEMASPFAMTQDGSIIIRKEALRFFFWDQIQEIRSSCNNTMQYALASYGVWRDGGIDRKCLIEKLDTIVDEELNMFIYHEVGELLQKTLNAEHLQKIVGRFPSSVMEFVCRAVKDILADTHPCGLLSYIIREQRSSTLAFYVSFLDGLREKLFPEMAVSRQLFVKDGDWNHVRKAKQSCWVKNLKLAKEIASIAEMIGTRSDQQITTDFSNRILEPLGLDKMADS